MNRRSPPDGMPAPGESLVQALSENGTDTISCEQGGLPYHPSLPCPGQRRNGIRLSGKRDHALTRDALFVIRRNGECHVIAESYFYKTEPYYTILSLEYEGELVRPASSAVLDAYVIPVCLERIKKAGIPVCEWGISQAYVPLPALLYGLNYYATSAEYAIVRDNEAAKDRIRHITNNGKYPFCFQKFPDGADILECTAIFGKTMDASDSIAKYASRIYDVFGLPLMRMVFVHSGGSYSLSSLSPLRYSRLTEAERSVLTAYISSQEFL